MAGGTQRKTKASTARSRPGSRESRVATARKMLVGEKRRISSQHMFEEDGTQIEYLVKKGLTATRRKRANASPGKAEDGQQVKSVLRQFALTTVEKGVDGLVVEFAELKAMTSVPPTKTAFEANPDKNRYRDVFCKDETRVVLTWPQGCTNNYIHANYVSVRGNKRFICTQEKTIDDFWRMMWEQRCRAIVMLCGVFEQGKKKCEVYYPEKPNDTMTTPSNVTIKNTGSNDVEKILTITTLEMSAEGETIVVKHYLWKAWPDRGVPQNTMACLRLLAQLKPYSPVVVHCSAGIGRTGTVVGLDMTQQVILNGEPLSMFNVVKELRSFRHGSVQTDLQYIYMHRVLLGLAENKKVTKREELLPFFNCYDAFLKSHGC